MNIKMIIALICLIYCIAPAYQVADRELASLLEPARVLDWTKMENRPSLDRRINMADNLFSYGFKTRLVDGLITNSELDHWPACLVSYYRNRNRENLNRADYGFLDSYKCKRAPGDREAIIVFYGQNTEMDDQFKAYPGFIVYFKNGGVDQSPFTYNEEINAYDLELANSLKPTKITKWDHFLPEPSVFLIVKVMNELKKIRFTPEVVDILVYNSKMEHWPAGLVSYLNNGDVGNRSLDIYEYKCKRIPGEQEAVIVFNFNNPGMSEEMKVNPGFIVLFNDGAIEDDEVEIDLQEMRKSVKQAKCVIN